MIAKIWSKKRLREFMKTFFLKNGSLVFFLGMAFFSMLFYSPAFFSPFISDDYDWLLSSTDRHPMTFFFSNYAGHHDGGSYAPLVNLIFFTVSRLFGGGSLGFHLASVFLHVANGLLIFLIGKKLFSQKVGFAASAAFLFFFQSIEAVVWISALVHLLATFFYLVCWYLFLRYFESKKNAFFFLSLFVYFLALITKEIAMSFPLQLLWILIWKKEISPQRRRLFFDTALFFLAIAGFLLIRYKTTGALFGYYGEKSFFFEWRVYALHLAQMLGNMFVTGSWRVGVQAFIAHHLTDIIVICAGIAIFVGAFYRSLFRHFVLGIALLCIPFLPYLPLSLNPLNNEGERYFYLPSAVLFIFIASALVAMIERFENIAAEKNRALKRSIKTGCFESAVLMALIIVWIWIGVPKIVHYKTAAVIAQNIVETFGAVVDRSNSNAGHVFLFLPESYESAPVFRNSLRQALKYHYPKYDLDAIVLPLYTVLDAENVGMRNFEFIKITDGWLWRSKKDDFLFSGPQKITSQDVEVEILDYDRFFRGSRVTVRFSQDFLEHNQGKQIYYWYFDEGGLKLMNENP